MATILIIDDSLIVRNSLDKQCKSKGYATFIADSGEAGVKILQEEQIDLIITDILMPGMSGEDVIRHVKSTPSIAYIPILVISGQSSQESIVRCIELGAEDLLSKPFVPEILHARINSCLEKSDFRKREIHMREEKAAEKCSSKMIGAVCHNFSQPLTSAICNLSTLQKFFDRLVQLLNHVRENMDPESRKVCDEMAREFVLENHNSTAVLDDLFQGVQETSEDTFRSLKKISSLIHDLQSLVRPSSMNYLDNVDIIDLEESKKYTVLVACGNDASLVQYSELTATMGYHVISAATPKEAELQAIFNSPHLILIGSCKDVPDHFTEILRLKSMGELQVPIIMIADHDQSAIDVMFPDAINKFCTLDEIKNRVILEENINNLIHQSGVIPGK